MPEVDPEPKSSGGRKWLYRPLWLLLALLLVGGAEYTHWDYARYRLVDTAEGVYQSKAFPADVLVEEARALQLKTVVDLRDLHDQEMIDLVEAQRAALEGTGIRHVHIPMRQQPSPEAVLEFLEVSGDPANRPLLIHCDHGVARSILMAAAYRIVHEGWDNERAWRGTARLPDSMRFLNAVIPSLGAVRRGSYKGDWVLEFDLEKVKAEAAAAKASRSEQGQDRNR